jgi:catechol 2,3-dioxygenase-like lactoylglutathione lyase family enzyme
MIKLSNFNVWVHDQDEALAFYTEKLGWEVRADVTLPEIPDFRVVDGKVAQVTVARVVD